MIQLVDQRSESTHSRECTSLQLADQLFMRLDAQSIRYCHWKSNQSLPEALSGVGDLDLLIHPHDTQRFQAVLSDLQFRLFAQPAWQRQTSVVHYYGHDVPTGKLLHLHIYYRLVTGGHFLKNYRLPLERLLFQRNHIEHGVVVPDRAAELLVFVIRKMLEAGGCCELALQRRDHAHVQREFSWLLPDDTGQRGEILRDACQMLAEHLPQLDVHTFCAGVHVLSAHESPASQLVVGCRCRSRLAGMALSGAGTAALTTSGRVMRALAKRLLRVRGKKWPASGGRVVALVGPEASGKSTLSLATSRWLSAVMTTRAVHMGKPTATWLGRCAHVLRRVRRLVRRLQGTIAAGHETLFAEQPKQTTLPYAIASVLLARDRYHAARRAYRDAARGTMVICDRYPSQECGAVDGPRLSECESASDRPWLVRWMRKLERAYYRRIPPPDVVIQLSVPVSVAQDRNRQRVKPDKEDDRYLAERHRQFHRARAAGENVHQVDTTRPKDEVFANVRSIVWESIG